MTNPADLPLITTIAVGLTSAFVFGLIAAKLKLSPIVGYLIAGVAVGPSTPGFVGDIHIAEQLSEIGVLLLMFGVGLHLSVRDLWEVRRIAVTGAIVRIAVVMGIGAGLSAWWDWPLAHGLMLGLALSIASTVVLLRALEEQNLMQSTKGKIAIGWLIVEDIVMVLALALIPSLAMLDMDHASFATLAPPVGVALGKIIGFVLFMVVVGRRALPWLLTAVSQTRSRELFTLAVFAAAMGIAFGAASLFGVSFALGAFLAGLMIRESDLSQEVADKALPLQDAFAVLFFVSVGMLFNPLIMVQEPLKVLVVFAVITLARFIVTATVVRFYRYPLYTVLAVSAGLAQIGEFSFVLAGLGMSHDLLSPMARDLILAGALLSISFNPAVFYGAKKLYAALATNAQASRWLNLTEDELNHLSVEEKKKLKKLVILVGYGRVGSHVSRNISSEQVDLVVVDSNRERVQELRDKGFHAIAGDGTHAATLQDAAIEKAIAIVIAVPNPFEARRILEAAKDLNPSIKLLVRAHNDDEMEYFTNQGVDLAVMGSREIARRMVRYLGNIK